MLGQTRFYSFFIFRWIKKCYFEFNAYLLISKFDVVSFLYIPVFSSNESLAKHAIYRVVVGGGWQKKRTETYFFTGYLTKYTL